MRAKTRSKTKPFEYISDYYNSGKPKLTSFGIIEYYITNKQKEVLETFLIEYKEVSKVVDHNCTLKEKISIIRNEIKKLKKRVKAQEQYDEEMFEYEQHASYGL